MLSIYYLKHIALRGELRDRERAVIETFNLNYEPFVSVELPEFDTYAKAYEKAYECLEKEKFCTLLGKLPHELKGDLLILFADRFVDLVLTFFRRECEIIKSYEIRKSTGLSGHIRCKRSDGHYVSLTSIHISAGPEKRLKFEFLRDCYTMIAEFKGSLIFHNLEWYKEWAKQLFLVSNSFPSR